MIRKRVTTLNVLIQQSSRVCATILSEQQMNGNTFLLPRTQDYNVQVQRSFKVHCASARGIHHRDAQARETRFRRRYRLPTIYEDVINKRM